MVFFIVITVALLLPSLSGVVLQGAGFEPVGNTDAIFGESPVVPSFDTQDMIVPSNIVLNMPDYGSERINPASDIHTIEVGFLDSQTVVRVTVSEDGLHDLCDLYTDFCTASGNPVRNARIDLRSGGAVIGMDIFIEALGGWQAVNLVVQIQPPDQLVFAGIDVDGVLYDFPPGELGNQLAEAQGFVNDFLRQAFLQADGTVYHVSAISSDDETLTVILR